PPPRPPPNLTPLPTRRSSDLFGGGNPATATTEIIDLSAPTPAWQYGPSMSQPRIEMNATILPNGKVLALGGSLNDEDAASASLKDRKSTRLNSSHQIISYAVF